MVSQVRWGILGAGGIAACFVHDLLVSNTKEDRKVNHVVQAIGSSSVEKGTAFVEKNGVTDSNNFGVKPDVQSYDELYKNSDVDIVYVATPHNFHKEQTLKCLKGGKHVLCEKPLTVNKKESQELFDCAKENKKFLMEAVWTRFMPLTLSIEDHIFNKKTIGKVSRLFADMTYNADIESLPSTSRIRDINLAAGAQLDLGIYTLTYSRILLDDRLGDDHKKFDLKSFMTLDPVDKVDHLTSILIKYEDGQHGILTVSELCDGRKPYLRLEGSKGYIEAYAQNPAHPDKIEIHLTKEDKTIVEEADTTYKGFIYEADAAALDILAGKTTNDVIPPEESLLVMGMLDQVKFENGLKYPSDYE